MQSNHSVYITPEPRTGSLTSDNHFLVKCTLKEPVDVYRRH